MKELSNEKGKKMNDFTLCGLSTVNRYESTTVIYNLLLLMHIINISIYLWNWIHRSDRFSGLVKCDKVKSMC